MFDQSEKMQPRMGGTIREWIDITTGVVVASRCVCIVNPVVIPLMYWISLGRMGTTARLPRKQRVLEVIIKFILIYGIIFVV